MSHRLACDHAGTIAAIANFAGSSWSDVAVSGDGEAISVVHPVLRERGADHVKTIVLTNGTRLGDAEVRARLKLLAARPYEI